MIDTGNPLHNYQQNFRNSENEEHNKGSESAPEGTDPRTGLLLLYMDNQGAGKQGRPVRQNIC